MSTELFVVDVDDMAETPHDKIIFIPVKKKAAFHGIPVHTVISTLKNAVRGSMAETVQKSEELQPLIIKTALFRDRKSGIAIWNSLVRIEFFQDERQRGTVLKAAVLKNGAIRMRPILLTALVTALGLWPITLLPVFSGLAWEPVFGLFASTAFTLLLVQVTYFALFSKKSLQSEIWGNRLL